jgi:hypothetical protein
MRTDDGAISEDLQKIVMVDKEVRAHLLEALLAIVARSLLGCCAATLLIRQQPLSAAVGVRRCCHTA